MQAGCNIDVSDATGRASGEIIRFWWDGLGLPAPAAPLQAGGHLPTCPCAQLCALDTPARGRRQSSALGFCSHTCWGTRRATSCGVSASGSRCCDSSSGLSRTARVPHRSSVCAEPPGLTRRGKLAKPRIQQVNRSFSNSTPVSNAKLVSVHSDLSVFPIHVTLSIDALWMLAVAEHLFNRNCLAQESVLHHPFSSARAGSPG